jgi:dolichol-phosphate mannosyltransferase
LRRSRRPALVAIRLLVGVALAPSSAVRGPVYWLSPLADPLAAIRLTVSSIRRPRSWRGRTYA